MLMPQHDTEDAGPHIQNVDAPGAEAQSQDEGQSGGVVGLSAENSEQDHHDHAHQTHIQEGGGVTAHGEVVGGDLAGLADDPDQTGEDLSPVGHERCGGEKCEGEEAEQQQQEGTFGKILDFFHNAPLCIDFFTVFPRIVRFLRTKKGNPAQN